MSSKATPKALDRMGYSGFDSALCRKLDAECIFLKKMAPCTISKGQPSNRNRSRKAR
jgi:hypothetical protein